MTKIIPVSPQLVREAGWILWEALSRIDTFCREMGSEDMGAELAHEILAALRMEEPTTLIWVGVDDDFNLVGHALASIKTRGSKRWVEITQYQRYDESETPQGQIAESFEQIQEWGRYFGCSEIRLATLVDGREGKIISSRARLFERLFDFRPHRLVMVKEITE